jgi:hypothetical protein
MAQVFDVPPRRGVLLPRSPGIAGRRDTMKAIVQDTYGSPDVMGLKEIDEPVIKDDVVLARPRSTFLTGPASNVCECRSGVAGRA